MEASQRALVRGPTFIRLLARLGDADVATPQPSLPDRLSEWIDWTRAVALSRVLDGTPATVESAGPAFASAEEAALADTRAALAAAIAGGNESVASPPPGPGPASGNSDAQLPVDFAVFRRHCLAMQRAMQTATGQLRGRLRDRLAAASTDMARLADVDAFMEQVLSPREQTLLAAVPRLLETHFERLRLAAHRPGDPPTAPAGRWLQAFRNDMRGVLLAELDVRFLPLEALLAALRTHSQGPHVQTLA